MSPVEEHVHRHCPDPQRHPSLRKTPEITVVSLRFFGFQPGPRIFDNALLGGPSLKLGLESPNSIARLTDLRVLCLQLLVKAGVASAMGDLQVIPQGVDQFFLRASRCSDCQLSSAVTTALQATRTKLMLITLRRFSSVLAIGEPSSSRHSSR
jgi:hypothetical protein